MVEHPENDCLWLFLLLIFKIWTMMASQQLIDILVIRIKKKAMSNGKTSLLECGMDQIWCWHGREVLFACFRRTAKIQWDS